MEFIPMKQTRSAPVVTLFANGKTREAEVENLKAIAHAIVQNFGERSCEVIIHDLSDLEHSIVWIEGNVTGRCIGGTMTDFGISKVQAGDFEDVLNYTTDIEDGRTLKSCSVFLRDAAGEPWGAFCVNLDVTPFVGLVNQLKSSILRVSETNVVETFSDDVEVTVRNWLSEAAFEIGKPVDSLTRADRLRVVQILDRKGLFQIKRAIPLLAKYLSVSRYTIYLYLNELRAEAKQPVNGGV
jgi:predicted transcriptional regulator YheO